jgi:hypothetical protein
LFPDLQLATEAHDTVNGALHAAFVDPGLVGKVIHGRPGIPMVVGVIRDAEQDE